MELQSGAILTLDGTLLDTLGDLAASANRVLAAAGLSDPSASTPIAGSWGTVHTILMTRTLAAGPADAREALDTCLQAFLDDYNRNWHAATRPYDGIATACSSTWTPAASGWAW
jgi:phosphoglycolate phosphatase